MDLFPQDPKKFGSWTKNPQSRNAKMALLLGSLVDAESQDEVQALLRDARSLLLEPFVGEPDPGSIYEGAATLDEKVERYEASIVERIGRAEGPQKAAFQSMLDYVLDELGFEQDDAGEEDAGDAVVATDGAGGDIS